MVLGAAFLLAFTGGLAGLYGLGHDWLTHGGLLADLRRLVAGTWIMALLAWLTVIRRRFEALNIEGFSSF